MRQYHFLGTQYLPLISELWKSLIPQPVVSVDDTAWHDHCHCETSEAFCGGITNMLESDTPNPFRAFVLHRDCYQSFAFSPSSTLPGLFATNVCFINLDASRKLVSIRTNHCPTQFMQPLPRSFIAPETKDALKPQSISPILLTGNVPHCPEPQT